MANFGNFHALFIIKWEERVCTGISNLRGDRLAFRFHTLLVGTAWLIQIRTQGCPE